MAFYDWNHDDKKDWQDDFIEYQIYKDVTNESDEDDDDKINYSFSSSNKSYNKSNSSSVTFLKILLVVIWVVYILTSCNEIFH